MLLIEGFHQVNNCTTENTLELCMLEVFLSLKHSEHITERNQIQQWEVGWGQNTHLTMTLAIRLPYIYTRFLSPLESQLNSQVNRQITASESWTGWLGI